MSVRHLSPAVGALVGALACVPGGSDGDIAPNVPAREAQAGAARATRVEAQPPALTLSVGESRVLQLSVYDSAGTLLQGRVPAFVSNESRVVTVNAAGRVLALAPGRAAIVASVGEQLARIYIGVSELQPTERVVVDLFPDQEFQVMTGWATLLESGQSGCGLGRFARYQSELVRRAVDELGINRVHVYVRSGMEAPDLANAGSRHESVPGLPFGVPWFSPVNDNGDPRAANAKGFQFAWFDDGIEKVLLPLRDRLAARGERLSVTLTYVDFADSPYEQLAAPEEYAELLLTVITHLRDRYGVAVDDIDALNEPEHTPWRADQLAQAIVAAGDRLKASGFTPRFIAPSHTSAGEATRYYEEMVRRVPRVREYLRTIGYHRYAAVSRASMARIAGVVRRDGIQAAMTEHIGADYRELHDDLVNGMASTWLQFALAWCSQSTEEGGGRGGAYFRILADGPEGARLVLSSRARFFRQYFPFVRMGAVRVGAASSDTAFSPVAFRNTNGKHVVVVRADHAGDVRVRGLPPGSYAASWTTGSGEGAVPPVMLGPGGSFAARVPAAGVVTIFAR